MTCSPLKKLVSFPRLFPFSSFRKGESPGNEFGGFERPQQKQQRNFTIFLQRNCTYFDLLLFSMIGCLKGTYGRNCIFNCTCSENSVCDRKTGECRCHVGWIGSRCEHGKTFTIIFIYLGHNDCAFNPVADIRKGLHKNVCFHHWSAGCYI